MISISGAALAPLWAELACLLILSRLLASLASRIGAPPIVGALVAGVLLNREILGHLWPAGQHWLFPSTPLAGHLLGGITNLCLLVVCFLVGSETDVAELHRLGRRLSIAATLTFLVPFAAGAGVAVWMSRGLTGHAGNQPALVLILGTATAVSSLPVIAWMVRELGLTRTWPGRLAVGVATVQDAAGFVLLAVAVAVTSGQGQGRLVTVVIGFVVLAAVIFFGGSRALRYVLTRVTAKDRGSGPGALTVAFATMLVFAAGSQAAHLSGALGAFVAGVIVSRAAASRVELIRSVEAITAAVFVPVYFASAGVSLQFSLLTRRDAVVELLAIVILGFVGKVVAALISSGRPERPERRWRDRMIFADLLNGRGTLQILVASVALRSALITPVGYTVIVTAALVTSLAAAPLVRSLTRGSTSPQAAAEAA